MTAAPLCAAHPPPLDGNVPHRPIRTNRASLMNTRLKAALSAPRR